MQIQNIYIENYGCSANLNNAEIIKGILQQAGLFITLNPKIADLAILNTCIVKGPTEEKMFSRIKELNKIFHNNLIITGCMPDIDILAKKIAKINPRISVIGSHHIKDIAKAVKKVSESKVISLTGQKNEIKLCVPKINTDKVIGITQILEGCVGECSYCITRHAKGSLFSYPKEKIIENIKQDLDRGCKEIWLTSQDNAAYGIDEGKQNLPELLDEILKIKGKFFVRIGMMNPNHVLKILDSLIECYKNKKMFKFLHIPIQSGSDNVLEDMKRHYKTKDVIKIINAFRKEFPEMTISTDIIVGYPTETEKDFQETLNLIREIKPRILNTSKFWPRKRTEASRLKQIHAKIAKQRAKELMSLHSIIALEDNSKSVGKETECIADKHGFDNTFLARDNNYRLIILQEKSILGKFLKIKIIKASAHYLYGEILEKET